MQLIRNLNNIGRFNLIQTAVCIGNFDGLHLGHQNLLEELNKQAKKNNLQSLAITFEPQPFEFFNKKIDSRLTNFQEKYSLFKKTKVDYLLVVHFNKKIANIKADYFLSKILLKKLKMKTLVVGDDFVFGKNKEANFNFLQKKSQELKFNIFKMSSFFLKNKRISSSLIRNEIYKNNLRTAKKFLGYNFFIQQRVIHGKKIGKKLGFPTANLAIKKTKLKLNGVFLAQVFANKKKYNALANLGIKPTFNKNKYLVEVHLLNFNENLYGKKIKVELIKKIRDEKKFDDKEQLKKQLHQDKKAAIFYFNHKNV